MKNRKQSLEETYINKALHYKKELKNCKWWEFKKKKDLKIAINTSIELAMMYSNIFENR